MQKMYSAILTGEFSTDGNVVPFYKKKNVWVLYCFVLNPTDFVNLFVNGS